MIDSALQDMMQSLSESIGNAIDIGFYLLGFIMFLSLTRFLLTGR